MKTLSRMGMVAAAVAVVALSPSARADEGAPTLGVSLDGYVAPILDDSVTAISGSQSQERHGLVGFTTLGNFGPYALGGVVDGFPGIFGGGRLTVGGLAGWQPQIGRYRYQVLAELGAERFTDVGGNFFTTPDTHETWLDYVGARLGTSRAFGRNGYFELGAWLFARKDLGEATVSSTSSGFLGGTVTTTDYHLGGYTAGAALRVGLRFDQHRRPAVDATELAADP